MTFADSEILGAIFKHLELAHSRKKNYVTPLTTRPVDLDFDLSIHVVFSAQAQSCTTVVVLFLSVWSVPVRSSYSS
jgi:hypothetical protein